MKVKKNTNDLNSYNINIMIPKDLAEKLKIISKENNISLASLVRIALSQYVKNNS